MRKQIIEYTSPLDALIALSKQLNTYEIKYQMNSEDCFAKYSQGETSDDEVFVEWAGNYQHYLALHQDIKSKLKDSDRIYQRGTLKNTCNCQFPTLLLKF